MTARHTVCLQPIGVQHQVEHNTALRDILTNYGFEFPCNGKGTCGKCKIRLIAGNIETDKRHEDLLYQKKLSLEWRLACHSRITEDVTIYIDRSDCVVQTDSSYFNISPEEGYGIAIDLGSTTLAAQLVNLQNGYIEAEQTALNPQSTFGADIISRIAHAISSPAHSRQLTSLARQAIQHLIENLLVEHSYDIRKVVIVGNSVMHHLFCGIDVSPFAAYPYISSHNEMRRFTPQELSWDLPANCEITFLPNISHFVGSDILSGIEAVGMLGKEHYQALIDLGTNGEIAIGNRHKILCTSTAAGPAFEGVHISQGMRASTGAIYQIDETGKSIGVIGNVSPIGICGSGLIDAIHLFLKQGQIDYSGTLLTEDTDFLPICKGIGLTDKDIREYQLAKAAICTGIEILRRELNISMKDIEHIYITGGLGNYLNIEKAMNTGLLEIDCMEQVIKMSNSALLGARMFLFKEKQKNVTKILEVTQHCPLESHYDFQDIYCEKLFFSVGY